MQISLPSKSPEDLGLIDRLTVIGQSFDSRVTRSLFSEEAGVAMVFRGEPPVRHLQIELQGQEEWKRHSRTGKGP